MRPYRGKIAFEPQRKIRSDAGAGKGRDPDNYREWKRQWRDKNREHVRAYHREYFRKKISVNRP
jgi:hypothetical protein